MQIVIDIPEERYKQIQEEQWLPNRLYFEKAIANGTPLPKGHGDLISRQKVIDKIRRLIEVERLQGTDEMGYGRERVNAYENMLWEVQEECLHPTIIKAESEKQCCDRNVCIQNEYNGIGCDECICGSTERGE